MSEPFVAEIRAFAFDFPPRGWARCEGQILSIAQNTALFALLGTQYGGNGTTNFALPDLRGRMAVHPGSGHPNRRDIGIGQAGGEESHTLTIDEMASHHHAVAASGGAGDTQTPTGAVAAVAPAALYRGDANGQMAADMVDAAGGGQAHDNREPYLALNYCIALQGVFPSR